MRLPSNRMPKLVSPPLGIGCALLLTATTLGLLFFLWYFPWQTVTIIAALIMYFYVGAMIGGITIGVVEALGVGCFPDGSRALAYQQVFGLVIFAIVLLLKPTGLLGREL